MLEACGTETRARKVMLAFSTEEITGYLVDRGELQGMRLKVSKKRHFNN
jgi:hypothetical protein